MKEDREDRRQPSAEHDTDRPPEPLIDFVVKFTVESVDAAVEGVKTAINRVEA